MNAQSSIPFSLNSGNIKKDIKAIKNWVEADLKYQVWSLNAKTHIKSTDKTLPSVIDKKEADTTVNPIKKVDQ